MKNSKGFLSVIALAVLVSALQLVSTDFSPKSLQSNVPGYSIPVDTNYSSFGCKSPGSWSNTVWCEKYGSTYDSHVTEANKHSGIIAMFKRTGIASGGFGIPNYGEYYVTGSYGSTAVGKNVQTYNASSIVKCPAGATIQVHSRSHHLYSPSLGEGFYDGNDHYWCEVNGSAVDPEKVDGRPAGVQLPDSEDISRDKLYSISFPGGTVKYKKIDDAASFYKCSNGYEGPYEPGVNQYLNTYHVKESWKKPYYRCLTADGSGFENAVSDGSTATFTASTGSTNISASMLGLNDAKNCSADYTTCQPSCAPGDSTCGGTGTYVTGGAFCASNAYIFQTNDYNTRYCAASPTTGTYTPPVVYSAKITHINYSSSGDTVSATVGGTVTITPGVKSYHPWIEIQNTGNTSDTYTFSHTNVSSDSNVSAGKIKDCVYTVNDLAVNSLTIAAGASEKVRLQCNVESVDPNGVILTQSLIVKSQVQGKTLGTYIYNITTKKQAQCVLNIQLNDNKTSYTKGDMVNYSYYCTPTGTQAATTYVYVVKPDGTSTLYTSGTNSSATTLGFSTSNLEAGSYTLKVCPDSACTSGVASISFTIAASTNPTTPGEITLNGTIFKDGQYVDPATSTLRNCVSPNYWMKEVPLSSGARGFHCMPNTPSYTLTSDHYPPTPCTGTLWAGGSSTTTTFSSDYCATSKDSSVTPPTPPPTPGQCSAGEKCSSGSWCNNGSRCHYPDGTLTCTSSWGDACPSGTKVCAPTDTNCREPGSVSPAVDDAWCTNAMSCYSRDGKELFCQLAPVMTTTAVTPGGMSCNDPKYPSSCRPGDKYCTEIGATNSNSGAYCAGGGKQCYKGSDLLCVGYSESCPADTGACKATDVATGCTEPGKYGTGSNAWCGGGGSVQCHKNDSTGIYCGQIAGGSMDPTAWETFSCPADTSRCRKDDKYCLGSIGAKGPSGSWCAVGMSRNEKDGTVTCVSSKDYMVDRPVVPPVVDECIRVTTIAYDSKTNDCKQFANTCNVPSDWTFVTDGRICKDGKLISIDVVIGGDDKSLIDLIEGYRNRIREYDLQLNKLPAQVQSQAEVSAVQVLVTDSAKMLKDLLQKFPTKSETDRQYIKDKLGAFNKDTFVDIESRMNQLAPYMDFAFLKDELRRDLEKYKIELDKIVDKNSEYYLKVSMMTEKLRDLLDSAENQTGAALEQLLVAIKDTRNQLEILVAEQRKEQTGNFLQETINNLVAAEAVFDAFIEEKDLGESKIDYLFTRFSALIEKIQKENLAGSGGKALWALVDEAKVLRDRLEGWLEAYGFKRTTEEIDMMSVIENYVDEAVAKMVEKMFGDFKNSLSLMLDEALQPLVLKVSELADKIATLSDTVAQSVSNLQYVVEKHREVVVEAKTRIIEQIENLEAALTASGLGNFTVQGMNDVMNTVATTTWCGTLAETVEANINTAGLAIESEEFEVADLNTLKINVEQWRALNGEACYTGGYTPGRDVPMEEWYYGPAQFNFERGWMNGYRDIHGNPIGQFGPGNATLKIEAVKMMMNLFGVARGDYSTPPGVAGVPNWPNAEGQNEANAYVNGALKVGVNLAKYGALDQPITRAETAGLIYDMTVASGANYFKPADTFTHVQEYNDAENILKNKESARIIESLTDLGIFKGSSVTGNFYPYNNLVRSEFATLNQRIGEIFGVAIGTPDGD